MEDILEISNKTGLPYFYIVKHVNNQVERKFIEWLSINMNKFEQETKKEQNVKQGGRGMATARDNRPLTMVIKYEAFQKLF